MGSETYQALRAIAADPHLWIGASALFLGFAAGQALRAILPPRVRTAKTGRRRSRRIARAVAYLSLALLFAACLLVFSSRDALSPSVLSVDAVAPYAAVLGAAGALAGAFPLAAGLPLAALAAAAAFAARATLADWTLYRSPGTIAKLLPYEAGPSSFRGELEVAGPGAAAGTRLVSMASGSASICVDTLEFTGPLGLFARLLGPEASKGWYSPARRYYRAAALVSPNASLGRSPGVLAAPNASPLFLEPPARLDWIDALLPLPEGFGLESGGALARAEILGSLAVRYRSSGPATPLVSLQSVYFALDEDREPRISARPAPSQGWNER